MIFAEDDDGGLRPVTREDLARVWVWTRGSLRSHIVLASDSAAAIEAHQREGCHSWATAPVMTQGG